MIKLRIDHKEVEAEPGAVLMEVIREMGVEVPSMCYLKGLPHYSSCMVCVVKDRKTGKLLPSCSLEVQEEMDIISEDEEVIQARKTALELLLSEHVGDCEAPCQVTCPAHMDIPLMNRLLARGRFDEALRLVKKDIALPSVLGRICSAPCEGACRRKSIDEAVSICLLKRYAGDHDLDLADSWIPPIESSSGKRLTVIGAGPAGLAAAWHLVLKGHHVTLVDRHKEAGGSLLRVDEEELPRAVLRKEVELIRKTGVQFKLGTEVDADGFHQLARENDALVVAAGQGESGIQEWGLPMHSRGVEADGKSYRVGESSVFVVGSALKPSRMAIRALGQGKEVSYSVDQYLRGESVKGESFMFNSRFGKLAPAEYEEYLKESVPGSRIEPLKLSEGLTRKQVMEEAARCLHCDCRELENCKLRIYSDHYGADQKLYKSDQRELCIKSDQHDQVIYESSKCIKCGLCVRITEKYREDFGFTFIGRGFDVVIGTPFNESLGKGLKKVALEVAEACPTGAISQKDQ